MIELIAVFFMTANISSAVACSEFWMISSVIGSLACLRHARLLRREMDVDVAVAVDLDPVAGMDDDGACRDPRRSPGPAKLMPGSSFAPS